VLNRKLLSTAVVILAFSAPVLALGETAARPPSEARWRALPLTNKVFTGDFDAMVKRRMIRVFVPFSRSLYFNDKGQERGLTAELVRDFERYINRKLKTGRRPITVYIVPTTRDRLLASVAEGQADIAAGNLTATEARRKIVDFEAPPDQRPVSELIVTGPKSPDLASLDDLSGKTVHVRRASSYFESLEALNTRFEKEGKAKANVMLVPDALEDEDMLEMLNAGILGVVVVDDWKAKLWAQILPMVKVRDDLVLQSGAKIGWAIRKGSPQLRGAIEDFYRNYVKKQGGIEYRLSQLMKRVKQIRNPTAEQERKRFEQTLALFDRYGEKYAFDPLMLAAQGYQESRLDQSVRSRVGAVGIMQLMPATGKEMDVGDIHIAEANIHAGSKYMDHLMSQYFKDAQFEEVDRTLFAFASYNAGPGRIARMRREAAKRGLNPNKWFFNVEIVTSEKVGKEPVTYVRNIYKYYVAYRLMTEAAARKRATREQVVPAK
jgi:membrane-bound lytic murein transglycosylase MltF